jgi:hypothetical protein
VGGGATVLECHGSRHGLLQSALKRREPAPARTREFRHQQPHAPGSQQLGEVAAEGAALLAPVAVLRAGRAEAGDAALGSWASAVAAMQAAPAVPHRRLAAGGASAGAGAAAGYERGITRRRPILQPVAPRDMGSYLRQRGLLRAGMAFGIGRCFQVSSCNRRQNRVDARAALAVS